MDKVVTWQGMTQTHGFSVEVLHDSATGMLIAKVQTCSPPLMPQLIPGARQEIMKFDEPEELKHGSLDELRERTKQCVATRCGEILTFID